MHFPSRTLSLALFTITTSLASPTPSPQRPFSEWMSTSLLQTAPKDRHYVSAVLQESMQKSALLHNNATLQTSISTTLSSLISPNGTLIDWDPTYYSLDDLRIGNNMLSAWSSSQPEKDKYKIAATALRKQLDHYPRTASGGFWHRNPTYKNQMWLDGIYMASTFYASYTHAFERGNTTAWADIARQFALIEAHTRNATSGLLAHGYDESKTAVWADKITGASPHVWDRGVGWYFMALVEVLQVFPRDLPAYGELKAYLTRLAKAVARAQDKESGGWWLIMDEPYPGMKGNYIESSATAMFTYAYLKGVRTGLLEVGYRDTALRAWELMLERFVVREEDGSLGWEGTVEVGSLKGDASYEYYISVPLSKNDGKGAGPFIFAATEMEIWKGW